MEHRILASKPATTESALSLLQSFLQQQDERHNQQLHLQQKQQADHLPGADDTTDCASSQHTSAGATNSHPSITSSSMLINPIVSADIYQLLRNIEQSLQPRVREFDPLTDT